jgi:hypothetical protein
MIPKCYRSLENGQRCSAPAMQGSKYCRHHDPQRPAKPAAENSSQSEHLALPPLIDKVSILTAVDMVVRALAEGCIKRSVAETLLSGIKLANRLISEIVEAGETMLPAENYAQPKPLALAASGDRPKAPAPFNPALRYPASQSSGDPATDRLVREILAQSHEIARSQAKI